MNTENRIDTLEKIDVMNAFVDGKKIECRYRASDKAEWEPSTAPSWNFSEFDYRVRNEPREFWLVPFKDGFKAFTNKNDTANFIGVVHVKEIP